ncbi:MAG: PEP-CTERM sorting domain-containing protein [Myxococcales bacterium]|nr:MAG: PEP-CTERM sorting domain-containing protein [Myxococcales bacterium]
MGTHPEAAAAKPQRLVRCSGACVLALALLLAASAGAQENPFGFGSGVPWIFQSGFGAVDDDPGFDHNTRVLPLGTTTLHLYATAGPDASSEEGTLCNPPPEGGSGDEICGMDVQVNVAGPAYIANFRPAGPPAGTGIAFFPTSFGTATKGLRLNSVRANDPIPAGAHKIGELDLTVTGDRGVNVTVSGNAMVLGQRQVAPIVPNVLAVPEPEETWLLGSALVGLAGLAALRRRRRVGRAS